VKITGEYTIQQMVVDKMEKLKKEIINIRETLVDKKKNNNVQNKQK
jgi:hypothetical protein